MHSLDSDKIIGARIEGIFRLPIENVGKFKNALILVKISGVGLLSLELADPDSPPPLRVHSGEPGNPETNPAAIALIGHQIVDIITSKYLASVSVLCDNGAVLTNDIGEFGNEAAIIQDGIHHLGDEGYKSYRFMD